MRLSHVAGAAVGLSLVACVGVTLLVMQPSWTSDGSVSLSWATGPSPATFPLHRLPALLANASAAAGARHAPAPLQRLGASPGQLTLGPVSGYRALRDEGAEPELVAGEHGEATPPEVLTTQKCVRMEAWGDVCVYSNVCFGDGRLKMMTYDNDRTGLGSGAWEGEGGRGGQGGGSSVRPLGEGRFWRGRRITYGWNVEATLTPHPVPRPCIRCSSRHARGHPGSSIWRDCGA
jgi:hypothetical protein